MIVMHDDPHGELLRWGVFPIGYDVMVIPVEVKALK